MALINFQKQFVPDVESGKKKQTIRAPRKHPIRKGDALYLYTGLRTRYAKKLKEVKCTGIEDVVIGKREYKTGKGVWSGYLDLDYFAQKDGFKSWQEMIKWFEKTHTLPFKGWLIKW